MSNRKDSMIKSLLMMGYSVKEVHDEIHVKHIINTKDVHVGSVVIIPIEDIYNKTYVIENTVRKLNIEIEKML